MIEWLGRWICHVFCGIAAAVLVIMLLEMFNRQEVLTFGDPAKNCLRVIGDHTPCPQAPVASFGPGDKMALCFEDLTWRRLVASRGKMFFFDADNHRIDFDEKIEPIAAHKIAMPAQTGPLAPKCRIAVMPAGIMPGPAVLTGTLTSEDSFLGVTRTVTIEYPRMRFIAKGAP